MKTYKFSFIGRQAGAIGITYKITDTYQAKDIHEALSLLYQDYDLIRALDIQQNGKKINEPSVIKWVTVRSNKERQRDLKTGSYK